MGWIQMLQHFSQHITNPSVFYYFTSLKTQPSQIDPHGRVNRLCRNSTRQRGKASQAKIGSFVESTDFATNVSLTALLYNYYM